VTTDEQTDYYRLKKNLVEDKKVDENDINNIILHVAKNRTRYEDFFHVGDIVKAVFKLFVGPFRQFITCNCRCKIFKTGSEGYKRIQRYYNGERRFHGEIDVVRLLKQSRDSMLHMKAFMSHRERFLLKIQRDQVISSDESQYEETDHE